MNNYGILFHEHDIKLHRKWFLEMVRLWGVEVGYRAPKPDKHWTTYGEIDGNYQEEKNIWVIFNDHPDQKTMKKLGWDNQQDTSAVTITVAYDTPDIQVGALFTFPEAVDGGGKKLYRVTEMSVIQIYPASITCQCVPEYKNNFEKSDHVFEKSSFNLISRVEEVEN